MKMKQNISDQTNTTEHLPPVIEKLRKEVKGFKVPDGYFDSLSPRITDRINSQESPSFLKSLLLAFRKTWVWAPSMTVLVIAVLYIFVFPAKDTSTIPVMDEWTQINMAYDPSYAQEAMLFETHNIESALEKNDIDFIKSASLTGQNELTNEEITRYLKEHEYDADLLNEY